MISRLIKKILNKTSLPVALREYLYTRFPVFKINHDPLATGQKKILIAYINPLFRNTGVTLHSNRAELFLILQYFIARKYEIDLISSESFDYKLLDPVRYDVIFGFGEPFRYAVKNNAGKNAAHILYLTESSPPFSLQKEKERIDYFYQRHRKRIKISRSGLYFRSGDLTLPHFCLLTGGAHTKSTYRPFMDPARIHCIDPTALINDRYRFRERAIAKTRKRFVWFGSNSFVHRGLDVIIDAFRLLPDCELLICGYYRDDEKNLKRLIGQARHIRLMGVMDVQSNDFLELTESCSFVISASCSEGMSTSLLTCMKHALIPVATVETGVEHLDELGYLLPGFKVEQLIRSIQQIKAQADDQIREKHRLLDRYVASKFDRPSFSAQFSRIMDGAGLNAPSTPPATHQHRS
ncbi:MAG: glycosyltransferase [Mangrovibacterium sp.]|nr:glycosyltransferase [Mangrovibacterium sp.]